MSKTGHLSSEIWHIPGLWPAKRFTGLHLSYLKQAFSKIFSIKNLKKWQNWLQTIQIWSKGIQCSILDSASLKGDVSVELILTGARTISIPLELHVHAIPFRKWHWKLIWDLESNWTANLIYDSNLGPSSDISTANINNSNIEKKLYYVMPLSKTKSDLWSNTSIFHYCYAYIYTCMLFTFLCLLRVYW